MNLILYKSSVLVNTINILSRLVVGAVFIVSGVYKILSSPLEFIYMLQGLQILPDFLINFTAYVFPYAELYLGLFLVFGLFMRFCGLCFTSVLCLYEVMLAQAWLRDLPIAKEICFGPLFANSILIEIFQNILLLLFIYSAFMPKPKYTLDDYIKSSVSEEK